MSFSAQDETLATAYLLGRLDEPERDAAELRLLGDDGFFEFVGAIEEELICNYLRDRLTPKDRADFEVKYNSTPALRDRVAVVSAVRSVVSAVAPGESLRTERAQRNWFAGWRMVFACGLVAALAFALVLQNRKLNDAAQVVGSLRAEQARLEQALKTARADRILASFTLLPGQVRERGAGQTALRIQAGEGMIELEFGIGGGSVVQRYRVSLETPERVTVWSGYGSRRDGADGSVVVTVSVPAVVLARGEYVAALDDADQRAGNEGPAHESYEFNVE